VNVFIVNRGLSAQAAHIARRVNTNTKIMAKPVLGAARDHMAPDVHTRQLESTSTDMEGGASGAGRDHMSLGVPIVQAVFTNTKTRRRTSAWGRR